MAEYYSYFHLAHLCSVFAMIALTAAAIVAPIPELRKRYLGLQGSAGLLAIIFGLGLTGILKTGFPLWVNVKIACWLLISILIGLAFRMPEKKGMLIGVLSVLVVITLSMVSFKPA